MVASGTCLREYQKEAANAIVDSVIHQRGRTFVVIFPRQSGKNEVQAQIEAYLLTLLQNTPAEIVKVSPTWKPQSQNAMRRLERVLKRNLFTRFSWKKEQGYIYRLGQARIIFLSAAPTANVVGATASTLLECDEAQDVLIGKWDKEINPMAASTNATRVFWGTAWSDQTLLSREKRLALQASQVDGCRRLFHLSADQVRQEVPAYGRFVDQEIAKLGREHPFIRSQYFSEEISENGGMFSAVQLDLMQGDHPPVSQPIAGHSYAFTLDIGGEEVSTGASMAVAQRYLPGLEEVASENLPSPSRVEMDATGARRDSSALTIFEIDFNGLTGNLLRLPCLHVVHRKLWTGASQARLFAEVCALVEAWMPQSLVVDATGVGEGLASFLTRTFGSLVTPFRFSLASKSELGWKFISAVETGCYKEYRAEINNPGELGQLQTQFWQQARFAQLEILPGPGRLCRWSVADGQHDPATGVLIHDDLLVSAALGVVLLDRRWGTAQSGVITPLDPMKEMKF